MGEPASALGLHRRAEIDEEYGQRLRSTLTEAYHLLHSIIPDDVCFNSRWQLRVNVSEEETLVARDS
ncbi:putative transcriptional regulator of viral defense system [Rhizobium rosettiformans]|jgi:predicted transcriptional regulator of viral defense system|nr:putative transcriptional regulator of viral defense system [Rhizobium rosettiformans]MDR7066761.1 putative transcriptional regulator of viral defense system [Rhizobium rosettiformans]